VVDTEAKATGKRPTGRREAKEVGGQQTAGRRDCLATAVVAVIPDGPALQFEVGWPRQAYPLATC
jgi:hypothetical protein